MIVVGLTGSIAMGKSETARMFRSLGVPVFDSDAEVHRLYNRGGAAVVAVAGLFPAAVVDGAVDRQALSMHVTGDPVALQRLEAVVHPMVEEAQRQFLDQCRSKGHDVVVLDIPLLFETGREGEVGVIVVVSAPPKMQRARALWRSGMTAGKFEAILARQSSDSDKRRRADFVVDSSQGYDHALAQVRNIMVTLRGGKDAGTDARSDPRH